MIGAVSGAVGTLTNAGVIDGGANGAIKAASVGYVSGYPWTNTGTIRSASNLATIQTGIPGPTTALTNSGTVANTGTGAAITGWMLLIQNQAGARTRRRRLCDWAGLAGRVRGLSLEQPAERRARRVHAS